MKPKHTKTCEIYFLEIDSFQSYQSALNLSKEINANGGAGYIYYDGNYHVFANFYSKIEDAKSVLENVLEDFPNSK